MGILGLSKLLGDYAPSSMKENEIKNYFGKEEMDDIGWESEKFNFVPGAHALTECNLIPFWDSVTGPFYYVAIYWCPSLCRSGGASVNGNIIKRPRDRIPKGIRVQLRMPQHSKQFQICLH